MWCSYQIVQQCGREFRTTLANAHTACRVHSACHGQCTVYWCEHWVVHSAQCKSGHIVNTIQYTQCTHQCTTSRWTRFRSRDSFPTKAGTTIRDFYGEKRQTWGDNKSLLDTTSINTRDKHFIWKLNLIQHITLILIQSQCRMQLLGNNVWTLQRVYP